MSRTRRPGLTLRLLAAHLQVVAVAALAAGLVAITLGPSVFRAHLGQASPGSTPAGASHAEQAFRTAGAISLAVALLAGLVVGGAVSIFLTARITRPVRTLAAAASDISAGHYDVDLPTPAPAPEFDTLTAAFGTMAARLKTVEVTRRRLLADLAHEMRTPVATLDAYLEGFEDGVATWDADTGAMLRTQTRRLARLAEDIAAVSRAEEGQLDLHLVGTAVQDLVETAVAGAAERYAQRGVDLTIDVAPGLSPLTVDPERIGQVLGNLLDNALRHTPPGGTVSVTAREAGDCVDVVVADSGFAALELLGVLPDGKPPPEPVLITDRYSAYGHLPDARRSFCWAHLAREFRAAWERGGVDGG